MSSHLMSELQDTAAHLVVIGRGRVIADTTVADLLATTAGDRVTLRTLEEAYLELTRDAVEYRATAGQEEAR
jgi:ABC-2 type transport system ATP-binding protein